MDDEEIRHGQNWRDASYSSQVTCIESFYQEHHLIQF